MITEEQYKYASRRVEELLEVITDTTLSSSPERQELSIIDDHCGRIRNKKLSNREAHIGRGD